MPSCFYFAYSEPLRELLVVCSRPSWPYQNQPGQGGGSDDIAQRWKGGEQEAGSMGVTPPGHLCFPGQDHGLPTCFHVRLSHFPEVWPWPTTAAWLESQAQAGAGSIREAGVLASLCLPKSTFQGS